MSADKNAREREWLTLEIVNEYRKRIDELPEDGRQDVGMRRKLRIELQERCKLTEVEAINILNGNHISEYIQKYSMMQEDVPFNHTHKKGENLFNLELLDQLDRLVLLLRDDYSIPDED